VPTLFASLQNQTFHDWQLCILDNNSADNTIEVLKTEVNKIANLHELILSKENIGFAGGHNVLFKKHASDYVLLLSSDMYLMPDCLEKLVGFLDSHSDVATAAPRLMRWNFEEQHFTDTIDSLGLQILRSRRVIEWYQGQLWSEVQPRFDGKQWVEVCGVSGALPVFRRSHVEAQPYFFDPLFESYKEDVDLAFRLRQAGERSVVVFDAVAYHDRKAVGTKSLGDLSAVHNKATQSSFIKYYSYRNHLMMLYKNEYWQNAILDFPWIFWYELKKFVYFLLFDRAVITGLWYIWHNRSKLKESRIKNKELRKADWKNMRKWWINS
jgi:GT2 family glycosyltransferase